jgi:hypothetical protein
VERRAASSSPPDDIFLVSVARFTVMRKTDPGPSRLNVLVEAGLMKLEVLQGR